MLEIDLCDRVRVIMCGVNYEGQDPKKQNELIFITEETILGFLVIAPQLRITRTDYYYYADEQDSQEFLDNKCTNPDSYKDVEESLRLQYLKGACG